MRKKPLISMIFMLTLITLLLGCSKQKDVILTGNLNDITNMEINYRDSSKNYTISEDKKLIKRIYDSIMATEIKVYKNPDEIHGQYSDPIFTIKVDYNNGKSDLIKSTESGEFIYRTLDAKGSWLGGKNTELIKLIGD